MLKEKPEKYIALRITKLLTRNLKVFLEKTKILKKESRSKNSIVLPTLTPTIKWLKSFNLNGGLFLTKLPALLDSLYSGSSIDWKRLPVFASFSKLFKNGINRGNKL